MVKELRYVFEASDVASVIFQCTECGEEYSYRLDNVHKPQETCRCGTRLVTRTGERYSSQELVLEGLRRLVAMPPDGVRVRFVVPTSPDGARAATDTHSTAETTRP